MLLVGVLGGLLARVVPRSGLHFHGVGGAVCRVVGVRVDCVSPWGCPLPGIFSARCVVYRRLFGVRDTSALC